MKPPWTYTIRLTAYPACFKEQHLPSCLQKTGCFAYFRGWTLMACCTLRGHTYMYMYMYRPYTKDCTFSMALKIVFIISTHMYSTQWISIPLTVPLGNSQPGSRQRPDTLQDWSPIMESTQKCLGYQG